MAREDTRSQIVDAADRLIYRQGYEQTSFADIASEVQISRGNFYYHFKSKDDILAAVIDARLQDTALMLERWQQGASGPADRIRCFIDILIDNGEDIRRFGCPVGTLTSELAKLNHGSRKEAADVFTLFRTWLARQFAELGRAADSDGLALRLLARSQGVATLASAYRDETFMRCEVADMHAWLDTQIGAAPAPAD